MSDYTKTTNFAAKDSLPSGNSGKIVKGTEIDTEFNNIQTAVATKLNTNNGALTGTTTFQTLSDGTIAITAFVDEDNMSSNSATLVPTQQSVKAYVDAQITAEDLDFQADSGGALSIDLDSETLTFTGGTGVDTSGSGNAVTFAIDSTVATLTGSQTLTNKTLTSPVLNTGVSGSAVLDEDNMASDSATHLATQQSIKAYVDSNVTAQDLDVTDGSSTIDIDLDSESLSILGGTGIDSTASGTGVTLAIDATVATLAGTQTLTNKTLTSPTLNTPTIGTSFTIGSATITEAELEILDGATVTTAELNVLDGITSTTAELNILDGVTSTAAELNILDGVTSTAAELNILDGVTSTTAELNILDGVTSSTAELNILDGVTSTAAELNILDGVTSTTAELNILDGVTATTTELNYVDGVTSAIQTQLDAKAALAGANFTGNVDVAGTLTTDAFSIEDATSPTLTLNDTTSANQKTTLSHTAGASVLTTGDNGVFGSFKIAAFDGTSTINRLLVADNGDVSLYEDGGATAKLVWDSSEEALEFADNAKATFGDGSDLQIYHDGSNSIITDQGSGTLKIQGDSAVRLESTAGERYFVGTNNGAARLYHDDSEKLATTSTGIDVTGTALTDGLTVDGNVSVVSALPRIILEENDTTDLNTAIRNNGGVLKIQTVNDAANSFTDRMDINHSSGDVILYGQILQGITTIPTGVQSSRQLISSSATGAEIIAYREDNGVAVNDFCGAFLIGNDDNSGTEDHFAGMWGQVSTTSGNMDLKFAAGRENYESGSPHMTLDYSGNLLVGRTSAGATGNGHTIRGGDSAIFSRDSSGESMIVARNASAGDIVRFYCNGVDKGSINFDGSNTISYTSSSDQRLKENIADADDAGSKVDAIQVRKFDWIADGSHQDYGMIAQELQTVVPEAVWAPADPDEMMGVDYSKLVPMLVKEIQSLRARVAQLENN